MHSFAHSVFMDSELGVETELPSAGTALENPVVYDSAAREIHRLADRGLVEILSQHVTQVLGDKVIDRLSFRRLR